MKTTKLPQLMIALSCLLPGILLLGTANGDEKRPVPEVDFARDVFPLLKSSCFSCHGPAKQEAGLRFDTPDFLKAKSSVVLHGKSGQSRLLRRIRGLDGLPRMPMGFAPLTKEQTARIAAWIDRGAVWSGGPGGKRHWAYVLPVRRPLPKAKRKGWARNPIDLFVLAKLEKAGLKPSPEASKETLVRRVTFDLTGLPPTPTEVDAFLKDRSPNAYERVVDRLLASPHYGERWARLWLDLARYADTNGYEKDNRRSIWPYRDWVIDAFNRNMPFDEFTIEQLAGDMLPNATQDQEIATGFHRNTMQNEEGGVDVEEQRWLTIVDRVSTTASVWMGSTLQCAQCHDHKYDPFTTKDYYAFFAFFDHADEPTLAVPTQDQAAKEKSLKDRIAEAEAKVKALNPEKDKEALNAANAELAPLRKQLADLNIPTTLVLAEKPGTDTPTTYLHIKGAYLSKGEQVRAAVPAVLKQLPGGSPVNRLTMARWLVSPDNPLTARVTVNRFWEQLFGRGIVETSEDFGTQGSPPTHPELLDWLSLEFMQPNGLTPRLPSLVRRASTAGKGKPHPRPLSFVRRGESAVRAPSLNASPGSFSPTPSPAARGLAGEGANAVRTAIPPLARSVGVARRRREQAQRRPLQWPGVRAGGLGKSQWDVKRLIKLMVMSATYRQSSKVTPALEERDPANTLLARGPRFRLEAEMIRDTALAAAGLLSPRIGGPSVFPYQPDGVWVIPYNGDEWRMSDGEDRFRRGLYTFWRRSAPYPSFVSFDASSREFCTIRRIRTNTPLQALTTLNDLAFFEAARGLARRMQNEGGSDVRSRIAYGFLCCTARRPKPAELTRLARLYNDELTHYQTDPKAALALAGGAQNQPDLAQTAALTLVSNVLLNLDETLTKE